MEKISLNDGFAVGDYVKVSKGGTLGFQILGNITSLSVGEILIQDAVVTGVLLPLEWKTTEQEIWVTGLTPKTALKYDFGLIENDEPINFLSKLTNTEQTYLFKGIDQTAIRADPNTAVVFVAGESAGNNKAAYTGSARVAFVGLSVGVDPINTADYYPRVPNRTYI